MNPSNSLLIAGLVSAAIASVYYSLPTRDAPEEPSTGSSVSRPSKPITKAGRTDISKDWEGFGDPSLRREISLLKEQVATLRADVKSLYELQRSSNAIPSLEEDLILSELASPIPSEELVAEADAKMAERSDHIASSFRAEPVHTSWSFEASEVIHEAFASEELSGPLLLSAECRSTLCRVEIQHSDDEQWDEVQLILQEKVGDLLPRMTSSHIEQADGGSHGVLFLAREGYRFP